jgi:superfamily II DNA or RNA helicase
LAFGKTVQALYILHKLAGKTLIIVHKDFLLNQWKERIEQFLPNAKIGIIKQDIVEIDDKDIIIGMLQSISMKDYSLNTFDSIRTVIVDECFIGNTKIITSKGKIKISKLYKLWKNNKKLPLIQSFNHLKNKFEYKKITYAWKKKLSFYYLIEIKLDTGDKLKCTSNHKILTNKGYINAENLKINDLIKSNYDCDNHFITIIHIKKILNNNYKNIFIYDIEVEDNHNYIVTKNSNIGIIVHNCHHIGSQVFSRALRKINSEYMLGLSATPNRKDGLTKVFKWYIGDIEFRRKHIDNNIVHVERLIINSNNEFYKKEKLNFKGKPRVPEMINSICENLNRTKIICYWIKELLNENRKIIVLSDRRAQLEDINKILYNDGYDDIGFYVGGMKQKYLDLSANKSLILSTFPMASEGLDIPGLDTEILISPKSDIIQAVGRILRKKHEFIQPKIIDVVDNFSLFQAQANTRLKLYKQRNYIIDDIDLWDEFNDNNEPKIIKKTRLSFNDSNISGNSSNKINKNTNKSFLFHT